MRYLMAAVVALGLFGCGKSGSYQPEQLKLIADSAASDAWKESAIKAAPHSRIYDSLFKYYHAASVVEHSHLALEGSVADIATIFSNAGASLNDSTRHAAIDELENANMEDDSLERSLRQIEASCKVFVDSTLKHVEDAGNRKQLRQQLLRAELFAPNWRAEYDSLAQTTNAVAISMISLIDSSHGNVIFDSVANRFRFRDLELTSRYNAFRDSLATLGAEEDRLRRATPTAKP